MSGDNFTDLRVSHVGHGGGDSIWPSFTDIMTVIVMIFLMALLAFLIRNTQLVDELQLTIAQKNAASQSALSLEEQLAAVRARVTSLQSTLESVTRDKDSLQQTVTDLETEITLLAKLRDELVGENATLLKDKDINAQLLADIRIDLQAAKNTLNEKVALLLAEKAELVVSRDKNVTALTQSEEERAELSKKLVTLTEQLRVLRETVETQATENTELASQLEDKNTLMLGLQSSKAELEQKVAEVQAELEKLTQLYASRGDEVAALQAELDGSSKRYKSLQEELDTLDAKYRKLIRPARNSAGKHVVHVEYKLVNKAPIYLFGEPGETPKPIALGELHQKLRKLKATHQQKLYTKVVIPDDSGLSYNEAWKFTQEILSKYDYYAQDYSTQSE